MTELKRNDFVPEDVQLWARLIAGENDLTTAEHLALNQTFAAHNYKPLPVVLSMGEGIWVMDSNGELYMDCLSAYSACNAGHCHPKIVEAVEKQLHTLDTVSRAFIHDQEGPFVCELARFCRKDKVLVKNAGVESVETAIKAARRWGYWRRHIETGFIPIKAGEAEILVAKDCFHGRTITVTGFFEEDPLKVEENHYTRGFGPFTPGFKIVDFGNIEAIKAAITPNTVAVLIEPIQGEAGVNIPPVGYLKAVRELCTEKGLLMIADEIQVGLGRTGARFTCDHENVVPDIYIIGKALGGCIIPVSAIAANNNIMDLFDPGCDGSTFGENPLACAAGRSFLGVYRDEHLAERSKELGEYFLNRLGDIKSPFIKEVRGKGLLIGVELYTKARPFCEELMRRGLLCKETHDLVIRFAPPLIINHTEIDWAMSRINEVFSTMALKG